jgi:hypothetical protein
MLGLGLVAFDTRQAMYVISVDVALTCRCQEKLKLKKLRLVVRRWWKRYAKFKAASCHGNASYQVCCIYVSGPS